MRIKTLQGEVEMDCDHPKEAQFVSMEPKIHSHVDDQLPPGHPLAFEQVHCEYCGVLVHAGNNECMQTWIEYPSGTKVCAQCTGTLPAVLDGESMHESLFILDNRVVHAARKWRHAYKDSKFPKEEQEAELELKIAVDALEAAMERQICPKRK